MQFYLLKFNYLSNIVFDFHNFACYALKLAARMNNPAFCIRHKRQRIIVVFVSFFNQ